MRLAIFNFALTLSHAVALAGEPAATRLNFAYTAAVPIEPVSVVHADITLLPKYEVRDTSVRLSPNQVKTNSAILAEAKARYLNPVYQETLGKLIHIAEVCANPLALILGGWRPNDATAMTLYAQDERLIRINESRDLIDLYKDTNPAKSRELRELMFRTYQHEPDRRPGALQKYNYGR